MILNKKKIKLSLLTILLLLLVLVMVIYFLKTSPREPFLDYNTEILLKESLDDVPTININANNSLPRNIYLTWETSNLNEMPPKMRESIELLKKVNDDCNIYIFDDMECQNFIKKYFKKEVMDAYNNLIPGAYKADLWRYCVLYKFGGIYQDIKYQPINNFKYSELLKNNKEYYVRDRDVGGSGIYNALLICKANNQTLLKCINKIIENCNKKYYGHSSLEPTGPLLMKNFFTDMEIKKMEMYFHVENNIDTIIFNERPILKMYNEYRIDQSKTQAPRYYDLWRKKNIYR